MSSKFLERIIEPLIVNLMQQSKIPGLALSVIKDGKPFYAKGFGARNLKKNIPFDEDTLFGIGSISKSFTALGIMQLVEQGKIDLQSPVKKYIDFRLGDKKNPIKIHHLLSHSSGFPELLGTIVAMTRHLDFIENIIPMSSWNDYMLFINGAGKELIDIPDKKFFYNNDMFTCLGLIIEKVSGMRFEEYIRENVLKPLGMNRSTYLREEYDDDDNTITNYLFLDEEGNLKESDAPIDKFLNAPGGLLSSVNELQYYLIALMNEGKQGQRQILQKSSIDKMWTPNNKTPESYGHGEAWYGYGWIVEKDFFGYEVIQHGGSVLTASAMVAMIPEIKMGVIMGVNCDSQELLGPLAHGILAILLGKDINEAVPLLQVQNKLNKLVGKYTTYKGLQSLEIFLENGILYAKIPYPLLPKPIILPLAPENIDELKFVVPIAFPGMKMRLFYHLRQKILMN
jgi:CubicO group peptidase (beta-lactamase class C family)